MYGEEYNMMMLEDRFFDQEWVQELSNEDFRMLLYLLHFSSKKTGIVELNMRQINFASNTGKQYTKTDVLERFSNMITLIPGKENTAIFHDYIATNWAKNGKPIDVIRNPLFKSVVAELGSFGLTIDDVNRMAKRQIVVANTDEPKAVEPKQSTKDEQTIDVGSMFDKFWAAYPSSCPRKTDKKKCRMKFEAIIGKAKDPNQMFAQILKGIDVWSKCDTWTRDGGQYIRAPLVWLNNENWNDNPTGGNHGNSGKSVATSNANFKSADAVGIF